MPYETQAQALAVASQLDCQTAAHKTAGGQWLPCRTDEEYLSAKRVEKYDDPMSIETTVCKVDDELGLVMGWAIICKEGGVDYFDVQGDHIPEASMLSAATDFMKNSRSVRDMHISGEDGELPGSVVFAFPMTTDIAKSFDIDTQKTGLIIAIQPESDAILAKFRSGEYTGFSIGGSRIEDEEV